MSRNARAKWGALRDIQKKTAAKETTASLAVETKGLLFMWLAQLNNKSNADIFPIGFDNS